MSALPLSIIGNVIERLIATRRTAKFTSRPGTGKTSAVVQHCEDNGYGLVLRVCPNIGAETVMGFAVPFKDPTLGHVCVYTMSDMIASIKKQVEQGFTRGVLLLDELDSADILLKKALSQVLNEYKIGDFDIPEGWCVVACSNRAKDNAGVTKSPSHITNRVTTLPVMNTYQTWLPWAETRLHWMWLAAVEQTAGDVFLEDIPEGCEDGLYPSERAVSNAAMVHCHGISPDAMDLPTTDLDRAIVAGFTGPAYANKVFSFLKVTNDLPKLKDMLANPETCKCPPGDKLAAQYTAAQMVSAHMTPKNADAVWTFAMRLKRELLTSTAQSVIRKNPKVTMSSEVFSNWLGEDSEMILDVVS